MIYDLAGVSSIGRNWGFRAACRHDHLVVAQWLYELGGINIRGLYDLTFREMKMHFVEHVLVVIYYWFNGYLV
jgi:hypothetical protein